MPFPISTLSHYLLIVCQHTFDWKKKLGNSTYVIVQDKFCKIQGKDEPASLDDHLSYVQLSKVVSHKSQNDPELINQLIPSYSIPAAGSSFGFSRSSSVSPGLSLELGFRESSIMINGCAYVKDGNTDNQGKYQGTELKAALGKL